MPMVIVGTLLLLLKIADLGPVGGWSWWIVLAPFAIAAVWWQIADSTGLTQRRAMDKMEQRKAARREKAMEALGLDTRGRRRPTPGTPESDTASRRSASGSGGSGSGGSGTSADPTQQDGPPAAPRRDRS